MKKARTRLQAKDLEILLGEIRKQTATIVESPDPNSFVGHCRGLSKLLNKLFTLFDKGGLCAKDDAAITDYFLRWVAGVKDTIAIRGFCRHADRYQALAAAAQMINVINTAGTGPFVDDLREPAKMFIAGLWRALSLANQPRLKQVEDVGWEAPPKVERSRSERQALIKERKFTVV